MISFYDQHWYLDGHCVLFPTRRLVRIIKGSGGVLHRDIRKCPAEPDGVIVGGDMNDTHIHTQPRFQGARKVTELDLALELGLLGDVNDRLSALRGALHQTDPTRLQRWWSAVTVLESWPTAEGLERGIDYLTDSTRGWSGETHKLLGKPYFFDMSAPPLWVKRAGSGTEPRLATVTSIDVDVSRIHPGSILRALKQTRRLRKLTVRGWYHHRDVLTPKLMSQLLGAVTEAGVEHLAFSLPLNRDAVDALVAAPMPTLRQLSQRFAFQQHWELVRQVRARHPEVEVSVTS